MRTFIILLLLCAASQADPLYNVPRRHTRAEINGPQQAYAQGIQVTDRTRIWEIWVLMNRDDIADGAVSESALPTITHWTRGDGETLNLVPEKEWLATETLPPDWLEEYRFDLPMASDEFRWVGVSANKPTERPYFIDPGEHFFGVRGLGDTGDFVGAVTGDDSTSVNGQFYALDSTGWYAVSPVLPGGIDALAMIINGSPAPPPVPEPSGIVLLAVGIVMAVGLRRR